MCTHRGPWVPELWGTELWRVQGNMFWVLWAALEGEKVIREAFLTERPFVWGLEPQIMCPRLSVRSGNKSVKAGHVAHACHASTTQEAEGSELHSETPWL